MKGRIERGSDAIGEKPYYGVMSQGNLGSIANEGPVNFSKSGTTSYLLLYEARRLYHLHFHSHTSMGFHVF